jgi:hypothetical protein
MLSFGDLSGFAGLAADETFVGGGSIGSVSAAELAEVGCFSSSDTKELDGHLFRFDCHLDTSG